MELERREWEVDTLEIRGTGDDRTVRGQAVPINRLSDDLGGFREVIRPGAVTESVKNNDIFLIWQHDTTQPISRTTAKNHPLVVEERKTGVWFTQPAAAFTEFQLSKIDDGVVDKMSFGFFVENREDEKWHEDQTPVLREILKMNLIELSPVTFAAYQSTKVAVRSAKAHGIVLPEPRPIVRVKQVVGVVGPKAIAAEIEHEQELIRLAVAQLGTAPAKRGSNQGRDAARIEHEHERERLRLIVGPPYDVRRRQARPVREYPSESAWNMLRSNGNSSQEVRALAYHEAAHSLLSLLAGIRLDSVHIYSKRTGDGRWQISGGSCRWKDCKSGDRRITAAIFMAGQAGETLAGLGCPPRSKVSTDETQARKLTKNCGIHEDLRDAKLLLRRHWAAVKVLASRLLKQQRVGGQEAEALIMDNLDLATREQLKSMRVA